MTSMKQAQLDFLNWEFGVFFHFGIRTFNEGHRDWDMKPMSLQSFNPIDLDCEDWVRAGKEAGATYAILVCKHHDGFANWPSAYTDYSVANTPWKEGKGDVVREFVDACRKYDMKVGLYYSPAQFGSVKMAAGEYDDYFINQIRELLTGYGKIDYLWFDGCGSENHQYDTARIVKEIRACQPNILLFNMWDPDTRWIGNEAGIADSPNKLTVSSLDFSIQTNEKDVLSETRFLPAECDFRMRWENWFFSERDAHTVKTLDELMGLYYYSVGRGANMLLNIGPDRRGRLPEVDKEALIAFGAKVRETFANPIAADAWEADDHFVVDIEPQLVNHVVLSEQIDPDNEVESFRILAYPCGGGAPVTVYRGATIGHKAICVFPTLKTYRLEIQLDREKDIRVQLFYIPRYV